MRAIVAFRFFQLCCDPLFGRIVEQPWVENGALTVMPVATASLAADHRVSDGHRGALFLAELRDLLQQPESL